MRLKSIQWICFLIVTAAGFETSAALVTLADPQTVYFLRAGAVESSDKWLPGGLTIDVSTDGDNSVNRIRNKKGQVTFSSTGYVKVRPVGVELDLPPNVFVYISAAGLHGSENPSDSFDAIVTRAEPSEGYNLFYNPAGQPKKSYSKSLFRKFGKRLNSPILQKNQSQAEQTKWKRIFLELRVAANRQKKSPKSILMIDRHEAEQRSRAFDQSGAVFSDGAWTVAVKATAPKHGFSEVPCAEFVGEVLRQAYRRAGYSHFEDFNAHKKNQLDFRHGASAVVKLAEFLNKAGWVPWDAALYAPPLGAIMMHESAQSPGHTYLIAGDNGRIIVDNGSPQGRDLRAVNASTIGLMFKHGVFFLPPGFKPRAWSSLLVAI